MPLALISLMTSPASSGVTTPITDEMIVSSRKTASSFRYGSAKDTTLRSVPGVSFLLSTEVSWFLMRQALAPAIPPGRVMGFLLVRHVDTVHLNVLSGPSFPSRLRRE